MIQFNHRKENVLFATNPISRNQRFELTFWLYDNGIRHFCFKDENELTFEFDADANLVYLVFGI